MKVAVLGAGSNGSHKIRVLKNCPQVSGLIAVDVREDQVRKARSELDVEATTDLQSVLDDPAVRLAFISTSNDTHKDLTLAAIRAGKAVLCEKPMANSLADARAMVEAAEGHDAYLEIGFELRYSMLYTRIKQWIDDGMLGDVINITCCYISCECWGRGSWRVRKEDCGDMFGEKLSHYVDLPRWWVGDRVSEVYTVCAPNVVPYYEVRDNYQTTYRFDGGAVSHLTFMMAPAATFRGDPLQDVIDQQTGDGHTLRYFIQGTRGAAEADVFSRHIKRWQFGDSPEGFTSDLVETLNWSSQEDHFYFHNTTDHALDVVRRVAEGQAPGVSARDAYETTRLCYAAERSADTGQVIKLDEFDA